MPAGTPIPKLFRTFTGFSAIMKWVFLFGRSQLHAYISTPVCLAIKTHRCANVRGSLIGSLILFTLSQSLITFELTLEHFCSYVWDSHRLFWGEFDLCL